MIRVCIRVECTHVKNRITNGVTILYNRSDTFVRFHDPFRGLFARSVKRFLFFFFFFLFSTILESPWSGLTIIPFAISRLTATFNFTVFLFSLFTRDACSFAWWASVQRWNHQGGQFLNDLFSFFWKFSATEIDFSRNI